jgi:hypothetical protein
MKLTGPEREIFPARLQSGKITTLFLVEQTADFSTHRLIG